MANDAVSETHVPFPWYRRNVLPVQQQAAFLRPSPEILGPLHIFHPTVACSAHLLAFLPSN